MRTRAAAGGILALLVPTTIVSCSDTFDSSRTIPSRGSLGTELYGVVCDRAGAQSLHEDLTGASYYSICHAPFTDTVDTTQLPAIVDGAPNAAGQPVTAAQQTEGTRITASPGCRRWPSTARASSRPSTRRSRTR